MPQHKSTREFILWRYQLRFLQYVYSVDCNLKILENISNFEMCFVNLNVICCWAIVKSYNAAANINSIPLEADCIFLFLPAGELPRSEWILRTQNHLRYEYIVKRKILHNIVWCFRYMYYLHWTKMKDMQHCKA